jgi:hypothetical protein
MMTLPSLRKGFLHNKERRADKTGCNNQNNATTHESLLKIPRNSGLDII